MVVIVCYSYLLSFVAVCNWFLFPWVVFFCCLTAVLYWFTV